MTETPHGAIEIGGYVWQEKCESNFCYNSTDVRRRTVVKKFYPLLSLNIVANYKSDINIILVSVS